MKNHALVVSVIMPMHNAGPYIATAIESILNQSYKELELLVIDDASTDNSRPIAESYAARDTRVKVVSALTQRSISATKNMGINMSTGEITMFCDSDDYYPIDRVSEQVDWLRQHPEAGAVCAAFTMVDHKGNNKIHFDTETDGVEITEELLSGKTRTHLCTFAIRSDFVKQTNGFREFFTSAEDIDFQLRLAECCRVFYEPKVSYFYRLHNNSTVHAQATSTRVFFEETARKFCQQRQLKGKDDLQLGIPPSLPIGNDSPTDANIQFQEIMTGTAWRHHQQGNKIKSIKAGFRACLIKPTNLSAWKSFLMLILKSLT